jgi:hypothetical protein
MDQPIELAPKEEIKELLISEEVCKEEEVKVNLDENDGMSEDDLKYEDLKSEDIGSGNLSDNNVNTTIEPVTEGNDVNVSICSCDLKCCIS